ncbi:MAG: type II toxin-antitoxin system RelB/DinJ family antitoxin [Oscillospiraceae bacterium]|nr:type II toxin-antitoxin system RelB/DinJ family antitoxin [Oscillospiraceae bacterium]
MGNPISASININIDSDVKDEAQAVFSSLGFDMATAINIFLRQTIKQRCIPFELTNETTEKSPKPGCMTGKIHMSDDFNAPLDDFREYME